MHDELHSASLPGVFEAHQLLPRDWPPDLGKGSPGWELGCCSGFRHFWAGLADFCVCALQLGTRGAVSNDNCLVFSSACSPGCSRPVTGLGTGRRCACGSGLLLQCCWVSRTNRRIDNACLSSGTSLHSDGGKHWVKSGLENRNF